MPQKNPEQPAEGAIVWERSFPLVTNRFYWYDLSKLLAITYVATGAIFGVILAFQKEWRALPALLEGFGVLILGMGVLFVLISLVWFGNRFPTRFTINKKGALCESISRRGKFGNRAAAVAGALTASPTLAGAGLLGISGESVGIAWDEVHRVKEYPRAKVISLMNGWRVVIRLYCTAENYGQVAAAVREFAGAGLVQRTKRIQTEAKLGRSPVPLLLWFSGFSVLAVLAAAKLLPFRFEIEPALALAAFLSLMLLLWWPVASRFFGLLALLCVGGMVWTVLAQGLEVHYLFGPEVDLYGNKYTTFQAVRGAEWIGLFLSLVGMAFMLGLSLAAISGRLSHFRGEGKSVIVLPLAKLAAVLLPAALIGVAVGWLRAHYGFPIGIQGLAVGFILGWAASRAIRDEKTLTYDERQVLLMFVMGGFLLLEALGISLSIRPEFRLNWLSQILSDRIHEPAFGFHGRGWDAPYALKLGPVAWVFFNRSSGNRVGDFEAFFRVLAACR